MKVQGRVVVLGLVFGVGLFAGCVFGPYLQDDVVSQTAAWLFSDWVRPPGLPGWLYIWVRNLVAAVAVITLSQVPRNLRVFRIPAPQVLVATVLLVNGVVPGVLVGSVAAASGIGYTQLVIRGLLPHGLLEVPVFLWACLLALEGTPEVNVLGNRPTMVELQMSVATLLRRFLPIGAPLLLCAALIETTVTPLLLASLLT